MLYILTLRPPATSTTGRRLISIGCGERTNTSARSHLPAPPTATNLPPPWAIRDDTPGPFPRVCQPRLAAGMGGHRGRRRYTDMRTLPQIGQLTISISLTTCSTPSRLRTASCALCVKEAVKAASKHQPSVVVVAKHFSQHG